MEVENVSVIIIDPQPIFRKGIVYILERLSGGFSINELSGFEKLDAQPALEKSVLFIARLDNYSALQFRETLEKLDTASSGAFLLFYSRESLSWMIDFVGSRPGSAYLSGVFDEVELNIAITKVFERKRHIGYDALWECVNNLFTKPVSRVKKSELSRLEREIAKLLLQGKSTTEIARMTSKKSSTISTVKASIFRKKNVNNLVDLIKVMGNRI